MTSFFKLLKKTFNRRRSFILCQIFWNFSVCKTEGPALSIVTILIASCLLLSIFWGNCLAAPVLPESNKRSQLQRNRQNCSNDKQFIYRQKICANLSAYLNWIFWKIKKLPLFKTELKNTNRKNDVIYHIVCTHCIWQMIMWWMVEVAFSGIV